MTRKKKPQAPQARSIRRPASRTFTISPSAVKAYLTATKMKQVDLARLLGVNAATLGRWLSDSKPDTPTSTMFLVLLPLLLAAGVDVRPKEMKEEMTQSAVEIAEQMYGESPSRAMQDKLEELALQKFLKKNPDIESSRRLFEALKSAWGKIDNG